jgi:DNA-binding winged helix-turn-helix (wHTH) protein/tetratricopeptide (TPR) repeat protein
MPNPGRTVDEASTNGCTFGDFVLDRERGALLHHGNEVRLRAKSLDVLGYLVRHPGRLIAKRELMAAVWPDVAVTDDSLVQCLVEIRRALGDHQAWIHTSRGRGYRFDGDVRPLVDSEAWPAAPEHGARRSPGRVVAAPRGRGWRLPVTVVGVLAVAAAVSAFWGRVPAPSPRTAEARLAYEEGGRSVERRTRESLGQAIAAYERAIALDPAFAPGHAGLADTLVIRGVFGGARPDDSYPRARQAALRAVELDPTLAEGHVALGHVQVQWDRDWRGAERSYRRALALDPNAPRAHMLYALFLGAMGRVDESLQESRTAASLRPESATVGAVRAIVLFGARRSEEAIEQGRRTAGLDPAFSLVHFWQALALADVGRFDEAMTEALASRTDVGNLPVPAVGYIHGRAGRPAEALEVLRALEAARARSIYVPATDLALVAVGMGDREAALTWLERAYDEHAHWMGWMRSFPPFDPLRDEPRFKAIVAKMKFP